MLLAVIIGSIISVCIGYLYTQSKWGDHLYQFLRNKNNDWEKVFNSMILREQMRLGSLFKRSFGKKEKPDARRNGSQSLYEGLENHPRESLKIIDSWFQSDKKAVSRMTEVLKNHGKIRSSNIPIKMYMREVVLDKQYKHLKGQKMLNHMMAQVYMRCIRAELLQGKDLSLFIRLNEDVNIHRGVLAVFLMKSGGGEKTCRQQVYQNSTSALARIKSSSIGKLDNIEKELVSNYSDVKSLFSHFRIEARKQKTFENEFANKQKSQSKSQQKSSSKQKSQQGSSRPGQILNPNKVPDALKILEMSRVIDLNSLKKKYRKMAMDHHPDRIKAQNPKEEKLAHEQFVRINSAFQTLSKKCS